jgi:hypothetical protein
MMKLLRPLVRRPFHPCVAVVVMAAGTMGFVLSLLGARLVEGLLFGVSPAHPRSLVAGAVLLLVASTAAALLPAWAASRIPARVSLTS